MTELTPSSRERRPPLPAVLAAGAVSIAILTLVACVGLPSPTNSQPAVAPASTASPDPTSSSSSTLPEAEPLPGSCLELQSLPAQGALVSPEVLTRLLDQRRDVGDRLAVFQDLGGVVCIVEVGGEIEGIVAWSLLDVATGEEIERALVAEGYTASESAQVRLYVLEPPASYLESAYAFVDGAWWFSTNVEHLRSLLHIP